MGPLYRDDEIDYLRSLIRQSPNDSTSAIARAFCEKYTDRTPQSARCKIDKLRSEPAKDESAEVQEWVRRREVAEREARARPSTTTWVKERIGAPIAAAAGESQAPPPPTTDLKRQLIIPDAHIPYHSVVWWSLLMQVARDFKPHGITIIGDFADFYSVSDHDKSPARANRLPEELEAVDKHLDELDALGAEDKLYIEGNHENRLERHLMKAPGLWGVVTTEKLLKLKERGWEFVPYKRHAKRGAIHYTHDVNAAGRNAVFKALDTYQHSVVTGHTHRLQYIVEGTAVGDCKVSAMFGWGGDVEQVEYMCLARARKDWALGFGIGYHDPSTEYTYLIPIPVVHGTCCVNGKLYRA